MGIYETISARRTVRKFAQTRIERNILERLVDAARLAPSLGNLQPLKYTIVDENAKVSSVFDAVKWAAYIAPAGNPAETERPTAFIAILVDTEITKGDPGLDIGAAAENMMLFARELGIGSCWMGAIDRPKIRETLSLPERFVISTVIALGYVAESPVVEDEKGSIKYYKDEAGTLHVPKRKLRDIIVG
jgi:nitroreductase